VTYIAARQIVEQELQESVDCIESIAKIDPRGAVLLKVAILAGMSGGVKLAALNEASAQSVAMPLAEAIRDISRSLTGAIN
jgi:hypothetical protein